MNFRSRTKDDPEINLIPLIDVLLVIIIFLMLTTTYSRFAELQIQLPTAEAEKQLERPNEISIVVSAGGQYLVNRRAVAFRDVPAGLLPAVLFFGAHRADARFTLVPGRHARARSPAHRTGRRCSPRRCRGSRGRRG